MRNVAKKMKGKKVLSLLLAMIMAVSVFAPVVSALGTSSYKVELAFNNLFVFDEWADNDLSTTVMMRGDGEIDIDVENGSFTLTKTNMDAAEIFTAFSMDTVNASGNTSYYNMAVEPSTTYEFSYNVSGNIWAFTPYVFFYDNNGLYNSLVPYPTPAYGVNSFQFTTPENVTSIQIRWTISDTSTSRPDMSSVYADVSDIKIYKVESILAEADLFNFDTWASKSGSGGGPSVYGAGTHSTDNNKVTITSSGADNLDGCSAYLTNFSLGAYDDTAFVVDTEPGKTYTLTYNLDSYTTQASTNMQALIPWYNADKTWISSYGMHESVAGKNSFTFTVPADVYHFQIVFGLYDFEKTSGKNATVSNIELHESVVVKHVTDPHRELYTYTYNGTNGQYGELPTPDYIPAGYVFSGWFTGENGTGERITPETYVKMNSMSVFAYFEPKVDTLELVTAPNKTTYTVGEKLDTTGLSLKATVSSQADTDGDGTPETVTRTFNINSNIYCTPEYLTASGTQIITANYGGKTVTFPVTVLAARSSDIVVNGAIMSGVSETNGKYTLNASADAFNRYKITYSTDAYVRGIITYEDGIEEEFFLEPGDNQTFVSFIDEFMYVDYNGTATYDDDTVKAKTHNYIESIAFTCLNNELGKFQLKAVSTELKENIPQIEYFNNAKYKLGVDILCGGVVSELYDKSEKAVTARTYNTTFDDGQGNTSSHTMTLVDYESKLSDSGVLEESNEVNLINTLDRGRYLQQSYYGTNEDPYIEGRFNNAPWKYNPVQGGNVAEEASKVIDYEVTDTYIYVKARPMEWEKWSDDHVDICNHWVSTVDGVVLAHTEKKYGNDVVSDTYVEAWYYFDDGMIKVQNRKVDYSGLPEATTQQEMPALYLVEPLNHFVYNDVAAGSEWDKNFDGLGGFNNGSLKNIEEPEFWGIVDSYNEYHYVTRDSDGNILSVVNDNNGDNFYDLSATCNENWAAFTASEDPDSFGVGIYSPGVTQMYFGVMPQIYASGYDKYGNIVDNSPNKQYRHATTINPTVEMPTSYIAPLKEETFRSFEATEYVYYLKTGTVEEIYDGFSTIEDKEAQEQLAKTKIAVPETGYLNPSNYTAGQYYVNNLLDEGNYYNITTEAARDNTNMYFGIHVKDGVSFSATVTNVTDPSNDIVLGNANGTGNREGETFNFDSGYIDSYISNGGFSLRLTNPINPGEIATARWDITVTLSSGATETHTVYTVLYAPGLTVGAVAEGHQTNDSHNEISSWITGANGVDHSQRAPLGGFHGDYHDSGYFREDPLIYTNPPTGGNAESEDDYILFPQHTSVNPNGTNISVDYSEDSYVLQTATNGADGSRAQSYLGLLAIDKSRYTNTNQIPNLKIGYDVLRNNGSGNKVAFTYDSLSAYSAYYTLGTTESFTATDDLSVAPDDTWTKYPTTVTNSTGTPVRETLIPEYDVSTIDGKYIHAINQAECNQIYIGNAYSLTRYSTAGTSVLVDVTDKAALRDAVLEGYNKTDADEEYLEKLENAATILGDPSASQEEIDNARENLNDVTTVAYYALKYDNVFSALEFSQHAPNMNVAANRGSVAYNNGTITVTNAALTDADEVYTSYGETDNYYLIDVKPNTEYVFEYDVTTNGKAQAFMFFYTSNNSASEAPTNISVQTNGGAWTSKTESNAWWGLKDQATGRYAVKFTTGPNTYEAGFRFGNSGTAATTSSFTNIKLVESSKYYADVTYTATETTHMEHTAYGELQTLTRTGYTFKGWADANGTAVTGANLAANHLSIYSQWDETIYTVVYNKNGDNVTGSADAKQTNYFDSFSLPNDFSRKYYQFKGWAYSADATAPDFTPGQTVKMSDFPADEIDSNNSITLYAVWERGYSLYYSANNGTGEIPGSFKGYTEPHNIPENTTITRTGHTFLGWSLDSNATSPSYVAGDTLTVSEINSGYIQTDANDSNEKFVVLHAVWYEHNYTINYNANGGKGSVASQSTGYATPIALANGGFTKDKYTLVGWSTDPDATNAQYALGESVSQLSAEDGSQITLYAVWKLSAYISDDTVVIDFGLPVKISVLSNDEAASNGTLVAIGKGVQNGTTLETEGYTSSRITETTTTLTLANGTAKIEGSQVVYTPTSTNYEAEEIFYYEFKTTDNKFYYAKVTVIPATSLYFEETMFTFTDSVVTVDGVDKEYKWQDVGTPVGERFQAEDRPGTFEIADANNVYGTDAAYNDSTTYSMGSAKFITVDQNSNKANPLATASFTFTGTGFDLFTVTDSKAGLLTVSIYKDGTKVKGFAVNTYYGYTYDPDANDGAGGYVTSGDSSDAVFQVPAVMARDLEHGTYTVVVEPKYSYPFDVNLNKEYRVYVDSVRIYDPMNPDNDIANDAYLADGEFAPDYLKLRSTVVTKDAEGKYNVSTYDNSSLFFEGYSSNWNDVSEVIKSGPKNEIYLAKGQAVAFNISATSNLNIASVQLGMKLINANGNAQVTIMNTETKQPEKITLTSATEQFYKLDSAIVWDDEQLVEGKFETAYPIVILNSSDSDVVISLTTLKWAFEDAGAISTFNIFGDEQTPTLAMAAIERALTAPAPDDTVEPDVPEVDEPGNDDVTEPDNGDDVTEPDNEGDVTEPDDSTDSGSTNLSPDSFVQNILKGILSIFEKLFNLLFGGAVA